jgi:hypothetical protein
MNRARPGDKDRRVGVRLGGIQPVYLPWLGYFDQMRRVDVFVIADEMPYTSSGWRHRNRVKGPHGPCWLTLPARPRRDQAICDVALDAGVPWKRRHMKTLRNFYARSAAARPILDALEDRLDDGATRLVDVTIPSIRFLAESLQIRTPIVVSSALGLEARYAARFPDRPGPTHRIIAYMEALGATELLEGESGQSYFDVPLFESAGMRVRFHRYDHPVYPQLHGPFVSHLSALDLLLCVGGDDAARILHSGTLRDDP